MNEEMVKRTLFNYNKSLKEINNLKRTKITKHILAAEFDDQYMYHYIAFFRNEEGKSLRVFSYSAVSYNTSPEDVVESILETALESR
jgi:hypothetical protein